MMLLQPEKVSWFFIFLLCQWKMSDISRDGNVTENKVPDKENSSRYLRLIFNFLILLFYYFYYYNYFILLLLFYFLVGE